MPLTVEEVSFPFISALLCLLLLSLLFPDWIKLGALITDDLKLTVIPNMWLQNISYTVKEMLR